jgi:aldehyde:ferredoxin oxidoreductase
MAENQYLYRQVAYDYEPIFAAGTMLGVTDAFAVLGIMDVAEKMGLDVMSAGVALAWATEALEKGLISEKEDPIAEIRGCGQNQQAMQHLGGTNDFYRLLGQGTLKAAAEYGGEDFACVLGQEMAGYATGEVYYAAQALGFRHSHLDTGGYSYDQKHDDQDVDKAVAFLVADERERVWLTSMVSCLFARKVYRVNFWTNACSRWAMTSWRAICQPAVPVSRQTLAAARGHRVSAGPDHHSQTLPRPHDLERQDRSGLSRRAVSGLRQGHCRPGANGFKRR